MKPDAVARAERLLGGEAESWTPVASRGWSRNAHWTMRLTDGRRAFLKEASIDPSPDWLRTEEAVYDAFAGAFMPEVLGWEDGERPLLVLQDLSEERWPPTWEPGDVEAVRATLAEVAAVRAPALPRVDPRDPAWLGWARVAQDADRFHRLGVATPAWLERALPELVAAEAATPLAGEELLHCDVRSDNLCLRDGRAVLVDWNHARVGNAAFDVAFWLPSLALEGGPVPEEVARADPGVDAFAALVAGFFAARAGLPPPQGAPRVRGFQRDQLLAALPWACRVVGLPPPDR